MLRYAKVVVGESNTVTDQDSPFTLQNDFEDENQRCPLDADLLPTCRQMNLSCTPMNVPLISPNLWVGCCKKILVIRNGLVANNCFPFLIKMYTELNWQYIRLAFNFDFC
jgi:hypothetical protein